MISARRAHWAPYLSAEPQQQAPLATCFVPVLAGGERIDDPEIAWPATLYPAGFRQQVFSHCAIEPVDSWRAENRRPQSAVHQVLAGRDSAGRDLVSEDDEGSGHLRLALTLNSLSCYRATVDLLGRHARSAQSDPHLTYEVARAAYQVGALTSALTVFGVLSGSAHPSVPVRLNAASRLVAHYARTGNDLDECARWVQLSIAAIPTEAGSAGSDFATGLAISRVHRAVALHASRRRDAAGVIQAIQAAEAVNRATEQVAARDSHRWGPRDHVLRQLGLQQNERLILEAALKAFVATGGRVEPLDAGAAAARLAEIDPWDPYTRLTVGDACWMLEDDEAALANYDVAARMGTLAGAQAAHRAAVLLVRTGRPAQASIWRDRAVELDPAAVDELSGD